MAQQAPTIVIWISRGLLGCACVNYTTEETLEQVKAKGRTERDRFDLAIEVPREFTWGVYVEAPDKNHVPKEWRRVSAASFGIAAK